MMHCSDKARALCAQRRCCGVTERGEFTTDSWCAGFNAGVAKALGTAIDLSPLVAYIKSMAECAEKILQDPDVKAALVKLKEGSDAGT